MIQMIGFIGAYDKIDFLLNIAKMMTQLNKKVLVIDTTILEKSKYIVPVINPTKSYIVEFEKIDIAVGFENLDEIRKFLAISEEKELEYDYVLMDIDTSDKFYSFNAQYNEKNYFVTSLDLFSLKKGMEILREIKEPINLTKVVFAKDVLKEDDEYINFLSLEYKILWSDTRIYFPLENGDQSVIMENQRLEKIVLKRLSNQYKENLVYITENIMHKDVSLNDIKKALKIIEKEG